MNPEFKIVEEHTIFDNTYLKIKTEEIQIKIQYLNNDSVWRFSDIAGGTDLKLQIKNLKNNGSLYYAANKTSVWKHLNILSPEWSNTSEWSKNTMEKFLKVVPYIMKKIDDRDACLALLNIIKQY